MNEALALALFLIIGFGLGNFIMKLKLPAIVGYIFAGIILGPALTNIVPSAVIERLDFINIVALSLIALSIGSSLNLKMLKGIGREIIVITLFQALLAFVLVSVSCFLFFQYVLHLKEAAILGLLLGAVSCATAPAGVFAVIEQYKARGNFTNTLLSCVALDDAVCIFIFGIVLAVVTVFLGGNTGISWPILIFPLREVMGSLFLGVVEGIAIVTVLRNLLPQRRKAGLMLLTFTLLACGVAQLFEFSPLLANMTAGFLIANLLRTQEKSILRIIKRVEEPIFILFFTMAGTILRFDTLAQTGMVIIVYITARWIGKIWGALLGSVVSGAPRVVRNWLGLGLIPQAGVAIGLTYLIRDKLPGLADLIIVTVLASIVINEIIGPVCLEIALKKSGEVSQ